MEKRTNKVKNLRDVRKIRLTDFGKIAVKYEANIIAIHGGREIFINAQTVKEDVENGFQYLGNTLFNACDKWGRPCYTSKGMGIILYDGFMCIL